MGVGGGGGGGGSWLLKNLDDENWEQKKEKKKCFTKSSNPIYDWWDVWLYAHWHTCRLTWPTITKAYYLCFQISAENAITGVDFYNTSLEERTLFEGFCRLVYETNNTWVTQFVFNMSNDEAFYSDTFSVYVYQSECQIVNNYTGNIFFTLQVSFHITGTTSHYR